MTTPISTNSPVTESPNKKSKLPLILLVLFLLFICFIVGVIVGSFFVSFFIGTRLDDIDPNAINQPIEENQPGPGTDGEEDQFEEELLGRISGSLGYPSEFLPAQVVCAETLTGVEVDCITTLDGQSVYELEVPPGEYYVYAELKKDMGGALDSYRAYYNVFVECGLSVECDSHENIVVKVESDSDTTGVNPVDWYNAE